MAAKSKASSSDNDKLMGVLSYLSFLVLIPIFAGGKSKFVKFHANQGLILLGVEVILWVVSMLLIPLIFVGLGVLSTVVWLLQIAVLVYAIIGIVNVVNGEQKQLPIIGGITLIK